MGLFSSKSSQNWNLWHKITVIPLYRNDGYSLATVDNNDTVLYGCIGVATIRGKCNPHEKSSTNWNLSFHIKQRIHLVLLSMLTNSVCASIFLHQLTKNKPLGLNIPYHALKMINRQDHNARDDHNDTDHAI